MNTSLDALRRGALDGAQTLRLNSCGLTEFPDEILGLADTLEVLDLSDNALDRLPDGLSRLHRLRVIFCSGNHFTRLPPVLGECANLSQVGFRKAGLQEVPAEALPPKLRWLTLTDNFITHLPEALGRRPALQKLMLAGNRLNNLPDNLAEAPNLELLRIAANRFDALPAWLTELPSLAWLAWSGNPFDRDLTTASPLQIDWSHLDCGPLLGEGASGLVYEAQWRRGGTAEAQPLALKLFKGAMTSDGLPEREMAASLAAGIHTNLVGAIGAVSHHPQEMQGLVMPLLPPNWRVLAGPPSLESCSRDVYDLTLQLDPEVAVRIARSVAQAAAHLHAKGLSHGDLYGHNVLWDTDRGEARLSDLGGASFLPRGPDSPALQRLDVRAWGLLLGELLDRCGQVRSFGSIPSPLEALRDACTQPYSAARPLMAEVVDAMI